MKTLIPGMLFLLYAAGCATAPVDNQTAQAVFSAMENRLLSANVLRVDYKIEAHGAVVADLSGDLVMQNPNLAALRASGLFAGADVTPVFVSDGSGMRGGVAPGYFDQPAAKELREGLLVGLMRMGVLHNLAMLMQGAPPDGTDGSVRSWVVAKDFGWEPLTRRSQDVELRGIRFAIEVDGQPAGEVVLWYDPISGLPVERVQVVHFDDGDMFVSERYVIETDGMIGPCRFDLNTITLMD